MRPGYLTGLSLATAGALLVGASGAHAALTTESCLAQKRKAQGNFQKCRAGEEAKLLVSKPADLAKCTTKFQDKLAKLSQKATDAGIGCRYGSNGDGTLSDYDTGLQWEKKNNAGGGANLANPNDVDNLYSWGDLSGCPSSGCPNGTAYTDFLNRLNSCVTSDGTTATGGFAGYCDWRLPTIVELQTILLAPYPCGTSPCIDPIFGPTAANYYWSSTTLATTPLYAWGVHFYDGVVLGGSKDGTTDRYVRAVRGGL